MEDTNLFDARLLCTTKLVGAIPVNSEIPSLSLKEDHRAPALRECSVITEPSDIVKLAMRFLLKDKVAIA